MRKPKNEVVQGLVVGHLKVLRKLGPDTVPAAWKSHPTLTWLVECKACGNEVRFHESHLRHESRIRHRWCSGVALVDVEELLEELEIDGDLA